MAEGELVWIHAHVERMAEADEYHSIPAALWYSMSVQQRDDYLEQAAQTAMSNAGGCGAGVIDEADVPESER
jgi:hypothetical protein